MSEVSFAVKVSVVLSSHMNLSGRACIEMFLVSTFKFATKSIDAIIGQWSDISGWCSPTVNSTMLDHLQIKPNQVRDFLAR